MKKSKSIFNRVFAVMLAIALVCSCNISAFASANSGASNVIDTEARNGRALTEFKTSQKTAGVPRRNTMHTYLKAGEYVYFGSSVAYSQLNEDGSRSAGSKVTGKDICVTFPDGVVHNYDVIENGIGYINSDTKVYNGPKITDADATNPDKYEPLSFRAEVSGVYDFEFHTKAGLDKPDPPTSPGDYVNTNNGVANQVDGALAYWDLTVADADGNEITGRTYSDYLSLILPNATYDYTATYYVVTKDGYIYKVTLNKFRPFGFVFFSNNQGLTTTGAHKSSIYHSIYDNDNDLNNVEAEEYVTFHYPNTKDTEFEQTNMIFYEEPNQDLCGILFDEPTTPKPVTSVEFYGVDDGVTYYGQGGEFRFDSFGATTAQIFVDFTGAIEEKLGPDSDATPEELEALNAYLQSGGTGVIELNGAVNDGTNSFKWDGKDSSGINIPTVLFRSNRITITVYPKAGEIHFPFIDVEGCMRGMILERLNGPGGRDTDSPDDSRFDIYYNNNPLSYYTIEGAADPNYNPSKPSGLAKKDGNYYDLSDGTRTYNLGSGTASKGGTGYFNLNDYPTISTLQYNQRYDEELDGESDTAVRKYIHVPNNSSETTMYFGQSGTANGGGNQACVDVWTYYQDKAQSTILNLEKLEILPDENVGEISGMVFYDSNRNANYEDNNDDYVLPDIDVILVDINGNPIPRRDNDGNLILDEDDNPTYYTTTTDANGYYMFKGVYYVQEDGTRSTDFYVMTVFTDAQKNAYKECTTQNDFNIATQVPYKQMVTLDDDNKKQQFGDIGYYNPNTNVSDLTVIKKWNSRISNRLDDIIIKLYQVDGEKNNIVATKYISSGTGWMYTFYDLDQQYEYYIEEWMQDDNGDMIMIARSESKYIEDFNAQITYPVASEETEFDASFTFYPNIIGPTIVVENTNQEQDYKVVFHTNEFGYSNELTDDVFRTYRRSSYVKEGEYALNDHIYDISAFYDIPVRKNHVFVGWYYTPSFDDGTKPLKWTTDTFTGNDEDDNDGDKYSIRNDVYHIYAHWVPVGTVTVDKYDEKDTGGRNYFGGFELFGVQIRNYRLDPNYDPFDDDDGNEMSENNNYYYQYKKEIVGLRFVTTIRNGLLSEVDTAFDDGSSQLYDYGNKNTYSTDESFQNIDYGYVVAAESNADKFKAHYEPANDNYEVKYKDNNTNGENTTSKYKYVTNTECTSSVGGYKKSTHILDHRNYDEYRIMSMVITYNELQDTVNMANNCIARPYLRYVDSNGLIRVFYTAYEGMSQKYKGCLISYNTANEAIKKDLHKVTDLLPEN